METPFNTEVLVREGFVKNWKVIEYLHGGADKGLSNYKILNGPKKGSYIGTVKFTEIEKEYKIKK